VISLQPLDFIYFYDVDGNATLGRCTSKIGSESGVAWQYQLSDLSDIFEELDLVSEYADDTSDEENIDDLDELDDFDPVIEEQSDAEYNRLNENVKRNLCIYAYPGSKGSHCEEDVVNERRLRRCRLRCRVKRAFKKIKKVSKKALEAVVDTVKDVGKFIAEQVKREITFKRESTLINTVRSARLTSSDSQLNLGVQYDVLARLTTRITVSLIRGLNRASVQVRGDFTMDAYLRLLATSAKRYQPAPLCFSSDLFRQLYRGLKSLYWLFDQFPKFILL
jgi:hypothetical protein